MSLTILFEINENMANEFARVSKLFVKKEDDRASADGFYPRRLVDKRRFVNSLIGDLVRPTTKPRV